jgi:hypothetical protein
VLCIRAGSVMLRDIGAVPRHAREPRLAGGPISITRAEYDDVCERLIRAGTRLEPDRAQAWRDFAGWRVNYDAALLRFASLCKAPPAPWSSDRAIPFAVQLTCFRPRA